MKESLPAFPPLSLPLQLPWSSFRIFGFAINQTRTAEKCFNEAIRPVAAVYDRRFYDMLQGKPAVIDRRYSRKARMDDIEFVNEFLTQDT